MFNDWMRRSKLPLMRIGTLGKKRFSRCILPSFRMSWFRRKPSAQLVVFLLADFSSSFGGLILSNQTRARTLHALGPASQSSCLAKGKPFKSEG